MIWDVYEKLYDKNIYRVGHKKWEFLQQKMGIFVTKNGKILN